MLALISRRRDGFTGRALPAGTQLRSLSSPTTGIYGESRTIFDIRVPHRSSSGPVALPRPLHGSCGRTGTSPGLPAKGGGAGDEVEVKGGQRRRVGAKRLQTR